LASFGVISASVVLGGVLAGSVAREAPTFAAGVAFFGFAAWTWRGDRLSEGERARAMVSARSAVVAVTVAFFVADQGLLADPLPEQGQLVVAGPSQGQDLLGSED
jgi:putative Ca2+/H+ antiporter (TMEM165/GDT1 family)